MIKLKIKISRTCLVKQKLAKVGKINMFQKFSLFHGSIILLPLYWESALLDAFFIWCMAKRIEFGWFLNFCKTPKILVNLWKSSFLYSWWLRMCVIQRYTPCPRKNAFVLILHAWTRRHFSGTQCTGRPQKNAL